MLVLWAMVRGVRILPHPAAEEHQGHERDAEHHAEANAERGGDQHMDVDGFVALGDQHHCDGGYRQREQRPPAHDLQELLFQRFQRRRWVRPWHMTAIWRLNLGVSTRTCIWRQ